MKKKKAMKLDYYNIDFDDFELVTGMDSLLRRIIGGKSIVWICPKKKDAVKVWTVCFWATKKEFKIIRKHMEDLTSQLLDEEYERLVLEQMEKATF